MPKFSFTTVKAAFAFLGIKDDHEKSINSDVNGITSLVIQLDDYNEIQNKGMAFFVMGLGNRTIGGSPQGNQNWAKQTPFYKSQQTKNPIPLLLIEKDGAITSQGVFVVHSIYKRIGPQGFAYFQIKLVRTICPDLQTKQLTQRAN